MKKMLFSLAVLFAVPATVGPALALTVGDYPVGAAASGIAESRHNLGSFGPVLHIASSDTNSSPLPGTTEICVFCHTPHHSNTAVAKAPLWNRVNAVSSYTAYGPTVGGSNVSQVGSVSLACLSCHDGTTTFDTLVNAPGKGGVNSAGADQGWTFTMPGMDTNIAGPLDHLDAVQCTLCHGLMLSGTGNVTRLNLTSDLSNDHPVSVTYMTDRGGLRPANTLISGIDLTSDLATSAATAYNGNLAQNRWAVSGFISDTATIGDLLRDGKVECSSCHDPHFKNNSWDEVESVSYANWCGTVEGCTDGQFLRRVGGNTGSGVCRTCHNK